MSLLIIMTKENQKLLNNSKQSSHLRKIQKLPMFDIQNKFVLSSIYIPNLMYKNNVS